MTRDRWRNLNGPWTCELDPGRSGYDPAEAVAMAPVEPGQGKSRRLWWSEGFAQPITVPFCIESPLSGLGHRDFVEMMWYHRKLDIPGDWTERVILHFGGVDYHGHVFIDGRLVGRHAGGQCGFSFDITRQVTPGRSHDLVLCVEDRTRGYVQPSGKQSSGYHAGGCHYTRVTGIWQTVWMEPVSTYGIRDVHVAPDLDGACLHVQPRFWSAKAGLAVKVTLRDGDQPIARVTQPLAEGMILTVPVHDPKPWSPATPFLYELDMEVVDTAGEVLDRVGSYAGLRKVSVDGARVLLNNEPIYQRLVLDQGYYPDGIWTAPTDAALKRDIELSMAAGFNGARLHQKVFEPRFHYWADRLGYLTWGESASWGCNASSFEGRDNFLCEWREIVLRDRGHPSIVAWTPWNEAWWMQDETHFGRTLVETYELTRALDPTRPVNTASGGAHTRTDLWTVHSYAHVGEELAKVAAAKQDSHIEKVHPNLGEAQPYDGQPVLMDEFGGIKWVPPGKRDAGWGYGDSPTSIEDFYQRLEELVDALLADPDLAGYCYTQLTDVEQEVNGIYTYERKNKFDMDRIHNLFRRKPAWAAMW